MYIMKRYTIAYNYLLALNNLFILILDIVINIINITNSDTPLQCKYECEYQNKYNKAIKHA